MVVQPLGFRSFRVDAEQGFFLNEKYLDLHGVNRHQDLLGRGWAMSSDDEQRDFSLIAEIGATAVRLGHYQHSQHVYDLTDKLGFVVWAEIPNIDSVNATPTYMATTQKQLLELIRQNYNHPSIAFWSVGNELGARVGPDPTEMVQLLIALAKAEDPSRLTAIATMSGIDGVAVRSTADAIGYNIYLGWYGGSHSDRFRDGPSASASTALAQACDSINRSLRNPFRVARFIRRSGSRSSMRHTGSR
jgi:beta-galactosidase